MRDFQFQISNCQFPIGILSNRQLEIGNCKFLICACVVDLFRGIELTAKEAVAAKETVTAKMSRWAASLRFEHLSKDAVYQAKRFLLDSVGCALGGYQQHDVIIALDVLKEVAGRGQSTVIGTGKRMEPVSASL